MFCYLLITWTCIEESHSQNIDTTQQLMSMQSIDSPFYWAIVKPLNFIDTLRKYPNRKFIVYNVPHNIWYDQNLISYLKYKTEDTTSCGFAVSALDSYSYSDVHSTVGEQVQCLIQGIKDKMYPPIYWLMNNRRQSNEK